MTTLTNYGNAVSCRKSTSSACMCEAGFDMTLGVRDHKPPESAFRIRYFQAEPLQTGGKSTVLEHFLPLSLP